LAIAVDQEGGRVARLRGPPFASVPPMREIGKHSDPERARRVGQLFAYELRAVGFNWDFAPVLDVDTNPLNPVIGDRSFHNESQVVAALGTALARGLESGGVASCAKHFPGHGDTAQDSHVTLPRLPHGMERLRNIELLPFRAYAEAGLASIMTAHVLFEAVDDKVPATMSGKVLQGILREELGFEGVIVSDDLEMKAIADRFSIEDSTVLGALAGVDLFLVCEHFDLQERAIQGLVKAVEAGRISRGRIEASNRRLGVLSNRFMRLPPLGLEVLGDPMHSKLALGLSNAPIGTDPTERGRS
jgi:beta-N-acetylhexosaminidase